LWHSAALSSGEQGREKEVMVQGRLARWILASTLLGCSSPSVGLGSHPEISTTTTATTGTGTGTGTGGGGSGGSAPEAGSADSATVQDATHLDAQKPRPDGPYVVFDDSGGEPARCRYDRVALASAQLLAGGSTPSAFAAAYNAELATLRTAGPFLLVLSGINQSVASAWVGSFGALAEPSEAGESAGFAGSHADVPYTLGIGRALTVARHDAAFDLKFLPPSNDALVPVVSVELSATLSAACGWLSIDRAKLLIPASSGSVAFHGSTIASLMGAPTESFGGQAASAWPLELGGTAQAIYAPAALDDGGALP
jgi:hypothetical protein